MAHSSDDPEDSHMGHSSKPLYITNEASFNVSSFNLFLSVCYLISILIIMHFSQEEEKEAIACLAQLKHKPVVYNRSKSRKEDAHNADHAQVQANISSGPPQTANHNARLSKTQVEVPSGFPVETENYIGGFSDWRRFAKQLKDKDESEVELFRGILKNEWQGANADGNSIESPKAGFSSSKGYDNEYGSKRRSILN